ncbi:MAG: thiamine ABC transporter substrate binding subunit [Devosia sp.]|uniref:thiamine ABC transporter substrate binding subunit n=1 Tax=unclassified Devosia TaxID=196773 RepID=UPI001A0A1469|nr:MULTISPECIES: thiamine ABC transporter substrate binding subunit [unclassified Devosia]MBF0680284.1 thiamine ABC transporter substrate binding subunit [Devosia sp.]WEJ32794.1 thiamine ABC transporter substrate binding subunit [Devosia sp. SD17-2]
MIKSTSMALAVLFGLSAAPILAQDVPTLTIYTYDGFASEWGPGAKLSEGFEAICGGCKVNWIAADSSIGTLRRVQLEGDTTEADLIVGLDTAIAGEARATGLFADHGIDLSGLDLPGEWTDAQFVPFDYSHFAFVYDADVVANPPRSFEELIALPEDFKIVVQDPRSATPGLGLVLWIKAAYGDRAAEIWAGLKPHILTVTRDWSDSYSLFLDGEADMALSYTTSPAYHRIDENDDSIHAALFDEGHYPQIEVAGILKSSDQQELAKQFLAWFASAEGQKIIPTTNWMFPVVDLGDDLDPAFATLPQPEKTLTLSDEDIIANSSAWIDEMLAAVQ